MSSTKETRNETTMRVTNRRDLMLGGSTLAAVAVFGSAAKIQTAQAQTTPAAAPSGKPPNILVIWGDDVGFWNVGAYSHGMMGYQTPNIDRIANEGARFTDAFAGTQTSCGFSYRFRARSQSSLQPSRSTHLSQAAL